MNAVNTRQDRKQELTTCLKCQATITTEITIRKEGSTSCYDDKGCRYIKSF